MRPLIYFLIGILSFSISIPSLAQNNYWNLKRCILYAKKHNLQIKQQKLKKKVSSITLKESQMNRFPVVNASGNYGKNFGRSIDPTTNQFVSNNLSYAGAHLDVQVTLFNFFSIQKTIQANTYQYQSEKKWLKKMMNDISLTITNAYLQILLAEEQEKISKKKMNLTRHQLYDTRKKVKVGALPESELADLQAQLARDSALLIHQHGQVKEALLQIKTILHLDYQTPFVPIQPSIETFPFINLQKTSAADIFQMALKNQPVLQVDSLRILSAQKSLEAAQASRYPTLSFGAQLETNYSSSYQRPKGEKTIQIPPQPMGFVHLDGNDFMVQSLPQNETIPLYEDPGISTQLGDNLRENVGISLSIPIFNRWQAHTQIKRAKINIQSLKLNRATDLSQLKKQIYITYSQVQSALESYHAARATLQASQTAFQYAQKQYEVGRINSIAYLTSQNHLFQAKTEVASSRYEYLFKMKELAFYKNNKGFF